MALPLAYYIRGVFFKSITNNGVIRINDASKVLILEHITFNSITSNENGGCVLFNTGHSIYQKDICARNVSSSMKGKYGYINILRNSENINYHSMISITDCTPDPVSDILWIGGGIISLSNYNSTNNFVSQTPGFYLENSVGMANASFTNILSGTATASSIVCSDTNCILKYSNFYNNQVLSTTFYFLSLFKDSSFVYHCVFVRNAAQNFLALQISMVACSYYENSFSSTPSSIRYVGSYSFIVNTQCHLWKNNDCNKKISCVSNYFIINYFMYSFSIFIILID
ncbi:hypothetical protein TVAG_260840 [Trichomonas vaginalis G3]|uniref:Uncharacterized protein n=1 Tax=Trichomonas vaginalis (strain ATCC PRA-98 / G3) TaxID=412133 RepID=A2EXK7_TRIV3|nr:hypothetical protein TVAGG3_0241170 [Trichomonas vaginalis G3]EAY02624.1 hypothetical protein TVAG_260840 [Trichomonas vaginalis G3]KAI5553345.1 hypothetical protein TVAGG3_0241170 [Trichomonas vaginalis G3]|eukprot:XP_001314847.1 hypothetical protein [Trichomonas vaginalis G3]